MRPILADSSWYIQTARSGKDPFFLLGQHARHRDIAICGMIIVEISRGLRHKKVLEKYQQKWRTMRPIESTQEVWTRTAELAWQLDREGRVLPLQNIHIAACALSINAVVLTYDTHFQEIHGVDSTDQLL